jgi:methylthioribose-1-phosphate isomerase
MADERSGPPGLRPIEWTADAIRVIDQTRLPGELVYRRLADVGDVVDAIGRLVVRGAPQLGAVGGLGVVVAMDEAARRGWSADQLATEIGRIRAARPTAVNLAWGVDRAQSLVSRGRAAVLAEALAICAEDAAANHAMSSLGADWILAHLPTDRLEQGVRALTHCNTGALATTEWGTALGVIRELHGRGRIGLVYADETRPLLQGARLTSWELTHDGIPHVVQADGAAASAILGGEVDVALIGADRIAANGDTANKIGSVGVALACREAGIPLMVVAPWSTVDLATATGDAIHVEMRDDDEVLAWGGIRVAPAGARARNPAFDVTPARLISAIVTERGIVEPPAGQTPLGLSEAGGSTS